MNIVQDGALREPMTTAQKDSSLQKEVTRENKVESGETHDYPPTPANETEDKPPVQICNHCGRSVRLGSGWFVNRVPDLSGVEARIEQGLRFPEGDYVCYECDQLTADDGPYYPAR